MSSKLKVSMIEQLIMFFNFSWWYKWIRNHCKQAVMEQMISYMLHFWSFSCTSCI